MNQKHGSIISRISSYHLILGLSILLGLYLTSLYSYLLFHTLLELFSIIVAGLIFAITWNTRDKIESNYLLLVGVAYLFIGGIDLVHTLAYEGMGVFPEFGANLPTQLWISARYMEGITLLAAPLLLYRDKINISYPMVAYGAGFSLIMLSVFGGFFPDCYVEGVGLTPFKKISEYLISIILGFALYFLYRNGDRFKTYVFDLLAVSIVLTIFAEIAFTFYISVYGFSNLVGHFFKLISFYLIYQALIVTGFKDPFDLLYRELKEKKEDLREKEKKYSDIFTQTHDSMWIVDVKGDEFFYEEVNSQYYGFVDREKGEIVGKKLKEIYPPKTARKIREDYQEVLNKKKPIEKEQELEFSGPKKYHLTTLSPILNTNGEVKRIIGSGKDITEQKRLEMKLQESKNRLSQIVQGLSIPTFVINKDHKITHWNKALEKMSGIPKKEIEGTDKHWKAFYDEESPVLADFIIDDESEEKMEEYYGEEFGDSDLLDDAYEGEEFFPDVGEDGKWIYFTAVTLENLEGEKIGAIESLQDITERKRAEERFRKIFYEGPEPMILVDEEDRIFDVNLRFEEEFGYELEDIRNKDVNDVIVPERLIEEGKKLDKKGKQGYVHYETVRKGKDGEFPVEISGMPITIDNETYSLGIFKNITQRKKAEEELEELSERHENLFEASPDPTFFIDEKGVFRKVNNAAVEVLGYEKEEIRGKSLSEVPFFPPETKEKIIENFKKRVKEEEIPPYTIKAEKKNGEKLIGEVNSSLLQEGGEPVGIIGIVRNITERKKAEEELRRSEERKDFLNTLLRQDLGSKYQSIQGYLQLLEEEVDLQEEQKQYLKKAIKSGRKVDEILGLAKKLNEIEGTELEGTKEITTVLNQVIDISGFVKKEGVEIEKNYPESMSKVKGDYSLSLIFSQILLTRTQISKCNKIRITAKEKEENVLVRIMDDGESLPTDIKNMFSGGVYTGETTGVGGVRYYMIKQIAEHNKAKIEIKDSELGGARFDVYLQKA